MIDSVTYGQCVSYTDQSLPIFHLLALHYPHDDNEKIDVFIPYNTVKTVVFSKSTRILNKDVLLLVAALDCAGSCLRTVYVPGHTKQECDDFMYQTTIMDDWVLESIAAQKRLHPYHILHMPPSDILKVCTINNMKRRNTIKTITG